jgi:phosphoserine phosphatase
MTHRNSWVFIVDLDNTLIKGNSFHILLLRLLPWWGVGRHLRVTTRIRFAVWICKRTIGWSSRADAKKSFQELLVSSGDTCASMGEFAQTLTGRIRPLMKEVLQCAGDSGVPIVLSTGALSEYVYPLAEILNIDGVVSTVWSGNGEWQETIGDQKARATLRVLQDNGWDHLTRVMFADSRDDLALAGECHIRFWALPAFHTWAEIEEGVRDMDLADFGDWARKQGLC